VKFNLFTNETTYGTENGQVKFPHGIAIDSSGKVYIADTANNRIQVFSENGTFINKWGKTGKADGNFNTPSGIAIDSSGKVYIADTANNRIQVFSENGTFINKWGKTGKADGNFNTPSGIAIDSSGKVYIADTANNRIQVFSENGTFINKWGKTGKADGNFNTPSGIAIDSSGKVYIADTANNRIQVFSENGTFINKWGKFELNDNKLNFPYGLAMDKHGGMYVTDEINNMISYTPLISFSNKDGRIFASNSSLVLERVIDGLDTPTAVAFLKPDDFLVLQKTKPLIVRVVNGQILDQPVLNLTNSTVIKGCMCDIAISKQENGSAYVFLYYYMGEDKNGGNLTGDLVNRLYRFELVNEKLVNPTVLLEMNSSQNALHNGGKMVIGPDDNLYLTIGDIDGRTTLAQNIKDGPLPDGSSGIIRITQDGQPVTDPITKDFLLGSSYPLNLYYGYGIRNSFGIDYDANTSEFWITDNGPTYGDEIDFVKPAFNGGWKKISGMSSLSPNFDKNNLTDFVGIGKYYDPAFVWQTPVGVTGLAFVNSDILGIEYKNDLFVGDINNGYLYHFDLDHNRTGLKLDGLLSDKVAENQNEVIKAAIAQIYGKVISLELGSDGLYITTANGKILKLTDDQESSTPIG
jgi:glucose/arabinose dehydrogenase